MLIASARIRQGLPVSDEILSEIRASQGSAPRAGIFTHAEQQDIEADHDRTVRAEAALVDAGDVFGSLQGCWIAGRRGVRVLVTGEHERFRRLLSEAVGADRVVVEHAAMTERESFALQAEVQAAAAELEESGIRVTRHGHGADGFEVDFLAADPEAAMKTLRERFGDRVKLSWRGASNSTFSPFPFASWHAADSLLHVFYGLPLNGERPGGCNVLEDDSAVVVALTIGDWRGAKTLRGGFIPSHATVTLSRPLGDRAVIDDSANRARPHWTHS